MLKILIPLVSPPSGATFRRASQPRYLTEIDGQPLLERIVRGLRPDEPHKFVFVTSREDVRRWAVDDLARLLAPDCAMVIAPSPPKSSVFASLLAMDEYDPEDEMLVAESRHWLDFPVDRFLSCARGDALEACVSSFRCTHPKWNYLRVDNGEVQENVAQRPVSDQAVGPFFWIRHARDYFDAAERHLVRHLENNQSEEASGVINELVLAGCRIKAWNISSEPSASEPDPATRPHKNRSTSRPVLDS